LIRVEKQIGHVPLALAGVFHKALPRFVFATSGHLSPCAYIAYIQTLTIKEAVITGINVFNCSLIHGSLAALLGSLR
jgi:hypothetical protein